MASPYLPTPGEPVRLALALCHEVGNYLAAARLSAYLVARETDRSQIEASAEDIESIATQAAAVLAHVRPLLADSEAARIRVAPAEVLRAVGRSLGRSGAKDPEVDVALDEDLPDVWVDADALHHVLVTLALAAWDVVPEQGGVRVVAERDGDDVVFAVEDDGRAYEAGKLDPRVGPRGRTLAFEVAATIVDRWGGRVVVHPRDVGTRVLVQIPAAQG